MLHKDFLRSVTQGIAVAFRRVVLAVELFLDRNLSGHASALTYSSILGAVPILAIVFAIARGFGFGQLIEEKLKANPTLSPEMTETIMTFVNSYGLDQVAYFYLAPPYWERLNALTEE